MTQLMTVDESGWHLRFPRSWSYEQALRNAECDNTVEMLLVVKFWFCVMTLPSRVEL